MLVTVESGSSLDSFKQQEAGFFENSLSWRQPYSSRFGPELINQTDLIDTRLFPLPLR